MQRIFGRKTEELKKEEGKKKFSLPIEKEKDPKAMDVDAMFMNEQLQLMKKGACFNCKQVRHLSRDCPNQKTSPNQTKQNEKDTYT